jgi:hypothetical protein
MGERKRHEQVASNLSTLDLSQTKHFQTWWPLERERAIHDDSKIYAPRRVPFTGIQSLQQNLQEEEHSYHHQVSKTSKHLQ